MSHYRRSISRLWTLGAQAWHAVAYVRLLAEAIRREVGEDIGVGFEHLLQSVEPALKLTAWYKESVGFSCRTMSDLLIDEGVP